MGIDRPETDGFPKAAVQNQDPRGDPAGDRFVYFILSCVIISRMEEALV